MQINFSIDFFPHNDVADMFVPFHSLICFGIERDSLIQSSAVSNDLQPGGILVPGKETDQPPKPPGAQINADLQGSV